MSPPFHRCSYRTILPTVEYLFFSMWRVSSRSAQPPSATTILSQEVLVYMYVTCGEIATHFPLHLFPLYFSCRVSKRISPSPPPQTPGPVTRRQTASGQLLRVLSQTLKRDRHKRANLKHHKQAVLRSRTPFFMNVKHVLFFCVFHSSSLLYGQFTHSLTHQMVQSLYHTLSSVIVSPLQLLWCQSLSGTLILHY